MTKIRNIVKSFIADQRGLETVEYAIITGLIVAGTIVAIAAIGVWVSGQFTALQGTLGA
jgi:Flp pilus assembly pilin Flp